MRPAHWVLPLVSWVVEKVSACSCKFFRNLSLSMGISEEIEDAKITAEKTKISKLKRRSENYPKFA